ncbi:MAG: cytochrome C oxidase subunit IV family protein [Candidatus Krumholzibacteria bacterium]|jgi:cytochrome c oxidase subunit 4|nr:cytochrome C oxidase subunit IV family protein [Candidatus Krumholzibacteria bacterium]MDP6669705.1 cytochrome C oxidase subunit IV family protein [Candidatus Krumholzibacteria bacterium]MDP6796317.1 cytochrome C oxidase subunit IV family protein [Candidatus Krumholzibacteria bacterium]MDP7021320.1 cytochrome C oxidase subunit IV family protein [Candidatus Krumholzibacteria bacterium]
MSNHASGHIVDARVLVGVFLALAFLTFVTVAVTWVDLGSFNIVLALLIAAFKASLVLLYFMHLRYDRPINAIVFLTSVVFLVVFVGLALLDTMQYAGDIISA